MGRSMSIIIIRIIINNYNFEFYYYQNMQHQNLKIVSQIKEYNMILRKHLKILLFDTLMYRNVKINIEKSFLNLILN